MSTFLLSKFFSIQKTKKLDKSDLVIPLKGDKKYPYVTRTVNNNGIESYTGYIDDFHLNPGNSFSLGLLQMNFQWHAEPWYCGQFVRRIVPKYDFSRNVMLYFLSVLQKNSVLFDPQAIKRVDGIFNSLRVDLPVTSDGQLDVQYMEQYIKRVEAVYIKRVEAYLAALGYESLDDCELSSQDPMNGANLGLISYLMFRHQIQRSMPSLCLLFMIVMLIIRIHMLFVQLLIMV